MDYIPNIFSPLVGTAYKTCKLQIQEKDMFSHKYMCLMDDHVDYVYLIVFVVYGSTNYHRVTYKKVYWESFIIHKKIKIVNDIELS